MIGRLSGRLIALSPEEVLIDCHGVGYQVLIPLSTYYELQGRSEDETVALSIHTHVREDAFALFGFWTERERALFRRLISVSGIGPKLARVVLSGMAPDDLVRSITGGDAVRLATVPGIGKKTAERMVLELRDKLDELTAGAAPAAPSTPGQDDLVAALVNLGYRSSHAEKAVSEVTRDEPDGEFAPLLRLALKRLARL